MNSNKKATIFVIDGHAVFREALSLLLSQEPDLSVCGGAPDAATAMRAIPKAMPDLVLLEVSLDGRLNGIELTKELRRRDPKLRILLLSAHSESLHAERAIRAGANGYIMKREGSKELLAAIRQTLRGRLVISAPLTEVLLGRMSGPGRLLERHPIDSLSDRELEIFGLVGQGYGTRQVADKLRISPKTIESHRENIRKKLHLESTFALVQRAIHWVHQEKAS